tara:strand:+ start:865 stop:1518 length:654 start_codon:yes stop_codon:yes gene_type:complete
MLRTVHLHGELGEKFGFERQIEANSFKDVLLCLQANFEDFKAYLADCYEKEIYFVWKINNQELTCPDELLLEYPEGDMVITPIPAGAGFSLKSAFKAIAGFALVIVGSILLIKGAFVLGGLSYLAGQYLFSQGLYELLAEDPSTDDEDLSYLFSGADQNINSNDPIPVCYGRLRIPGRPISFEIRNEDGFISSTAGNNTNRSSAPSARSAVTGQGGY